MEERQQARAGHRSAERVAFNDDIFRKANEAVREQIDEVAPNDFDALPLICECAEESCTAVIQVPMRDYERVRADPRLFFNAPGHEAAAQGWATVTERHEGYVVVEKLGRAAEIVEMLDDDG
jgi:hypothetical protein